MSQQAKSSSIENQIISSSFSVFFWVTHSEREAVLLRDVSFLFQDIAEGWKICPYFGYFFSYEGLVALTQDPVDVALARLLVVLASDGERIGYNVFAECGLQNMLDDLNAPYESFDVVGLELLSSHDVMLPDHLPQLGFHRRFCDILNSFQVLVLRLRRHEDFPRVTWLRNGRYRCWWLPDDDVEFLTDVLNSR